MNSSTKMKKKQYITYYSSSQLVTAINTKSVIRLGLLDMQILMLKLIFCLQQFKDLISGHVEFSHVSENIKPQDPQPVSTVSVVLVVQKV